MSAGRLAYSTIAPHRRTWLLGLGELTARAIGSPDPADGLDVLALVFGWSARPESPFRADLLVDFDDTARYCRQLGTELRGLPHSTSSGQAEEAST